MASAEQPLKKRKLYEPLYEPSPPPPPPPLLPPPSLPSSLQLCSVSQPLSQQEILRRRRSQEEIKNVYDSYKRITYCIAQEDPRFLPELEQAYLSIIAASRGCTAVQRMLADYIPRFASYCPNALEAAVKGAVSIHNRSWELFNRGEDTNGHAYESAELCIFGLSDIAQAATMAGPTSAVSQGISSAVFSNIFTFLISSFEGKDIFQIIDEESIKIQGNEDFFNQLKKRVLEEDESPSMKLSKIRALTFVKILFSCPKDSIAACFELLESSNTEGIYFLHQLTITLDETSSDANNCLLDLILEKDEKLRRWIFSRYKKLCTSASSEVISDITSTLEKVKSFTNYENEVDDYEIESSTSINGSKDNGGSRSMEIDSVEQQDHQPRARSSEPRDLSIVLPMDSRSYSFPNTNHSGQNFDTNLLNALQGSSFSSESPIRQFPSGNQVIWHLDGNPSSMEVFPASKQIWIGSLGPDSSESLIIQHFEKFGPINQFQYVPYKGFAIIEYINILDAVKAREVMRGRSLGGASLRVKFLDLGLGTRGALNGVVLGSSNCIYVGNISSQWAKDEVMHELRKVIYKGPRVVTDLHSEAALLIEYETPEEANIAMTHLRQRRIENNNHNSHLVPSNSVHANFRNYSPNDNHANFRNYSPSDNPANFRNYSPSDNHRLEILSPRMNMENNHGQGHGHHFQSNWGRPEGSLGMRTPTQGPLRPPFVQQLYYPGGSSWGEVCNPNHQHPISPNMGNNGPPPPFRHASGSQLTHMYQMPSFPSVQTHRPEFRPPLPLQPELRPPPPPSPPPPPQYQPPAVPLPPGSPPSMKQVSYRWQGSLSKSGVQYSIIYAQEAESDICKYANDISEPIEWPVKLDMVKRTDFRHVKTKFSNTPPDKREIVWLIPSSQGDQDGFQDFISYLKQRECAGVIKFPATKSMWPRLLFILPYSEEMCSMLSVAPNPSLCLIGLILPKETNHEKGV